MRTPSYGGSLADGLNYRRTTFDEHPAVQRIVMESKGKPGAFGLAMQKLPVDVVREIKSNKFDHVANGSKVGQADSI
ncbi:hypothetical protein [Caballeronia sp. LZ001]|uniref:hypothetical protein n=1 Tax=Caballeronia sp. LZ001 TaxID=3038553 RepID=UPI00285D3150|nr:hypothetical protein [Caballeronia sp. LZ001]MDR5805529.1 hypothetical protein [Caballeronia sp. LZ001]